MVAQRRYVLLQRLLAQQIVVSGDVLLVGRETDLGIHHYLLVAGQADQHVRLEAFALGTLQADLGLVFPTFFQACMLEHPLQHQFAPVALGLLALERAGQVGRFLAQAQVELLQTLQFLAQGETLARFLLVAFLHPLLERLDALLQWIEHLPQALLAGLGETLFALVEDLSRQFGELGPQLVAGRLQVGQALLVAFLLLAKFRSQRSPFGSQATHFLFPALALAGPTCLRLGRPLPLLPHQLGFPTQRGDLAGEPGMALAELLVSLPTGLQLRIQPVLGQLRGRQSLAEQGYLALRQAGPSL
ncbi:Uncharacterised protein [Klebsiella pneumoniae]|nr:Uncharacterised protein [Klebsiella pneumoniae]